MSQDAEGEGEAGIIAFFAGSLSARQQSVR